MLPGILFNHELRIFLSNERFYLENFRGFRIENYIGGIKIAENTFFLFFSLNQLINLFFI